MRALGLEWLFRLIVQPRLGPALLVVVVFVVQGVAAGVRSRLRR